MRHRLRQTLRPRSTTRGHISAFTLTELLTVIAVIGVLAALLLAATTRGIDVAKRIRCGNNVRQIGIAMQMFVADKHAYPPAAIVYPDHYTGWEKIISQTELDGLPTHATKPTHYPPPGIWHCPSASMPQAFTWYADYGYNCYGMGLYASTNTLGLGGHMIWTGPQHETGAQINDSEVAVPSEMIAIGDGFKGGNGTIQDGWFVLGRTYELDAMPEYVGSTKRAYSRHQGQANILYCDGHLDSPKLKFLFDDTSDKALVRWNRDHKPHRELLQP